MKAFMCAAAVVAALGTLSASPSAGAQGDTAVRFELNKAEQAGDACRLYLLIDNRSQTDFQSLKLDLVSFDADGIVQQRMLLETAPLPAGRLRLKVFDLPDSRCAAVSRLLINDIAQCSAAGRTLDDCPGPVTAGSRLSIEFLP